MLFRIIAVKLSERVVIFDSGVPRRVLGPGRHVVWGARTTEQRFQTDTLVWNAQPEVRALVPSAWYAEVIVAETQRGVLFRDGRPQLFLRPGVHRYWTLDPSVELRLYGVDEPMPKLTSELLDVIPREEYVRGHVREHERGLLYVQARLTRVLEPGRYALWTQPDAEVAVTLIDMRAQQLALASQELMTRDKVSLRLTLTVEYAVSDPALIAHAVQDPRDTIYLLVQLAARDYVAGVTLDELLEGRDAMTHHLETATVAKAAAFGARIERLGVKDIVLPGEMKTLLNRVIEAEKQAVANVILRREETAAVRALANNARVMAEQPVMLRLKELEAMKEMAASIDEVRLVVGSDGLEKLLPPQLMAAKGDA